MSDATNPAVAPDAQRYDWRTDWNLTQTRIGYDQDAIVDAMHRLAAYIERLEAERDALLAEHEAAGVGAEWGEFTDDEWHAWLSAYENAERVRRAASS